MEKKYEMIKFNDLRDSIDRPMDEPTNMTMEARIMDSDEICIAGRCIIIRHSYDEWHWTANTLFGMPLGSETWTVQALKETYPEIKAVAILRNYDE